MKKLKIKRIELDKGKISISLYFAFIVIAELGVAVGVSYGIAVLFEYVQGFTAALPSTVWMIIFSLCIGTVFALILNRFFFKPIKKLRDAMAEVAAGDFKQRLQSGSPAFEIQETYAYFNLMTEELQATEIIQSDFISNVSHEIKTPVSAIEGYAMLLQDESCSHEEQKQYVEKIILNTSRLSQLVGNILLLSKLDSQAIEGKISRFRLDEQIRGSIMLLEQNWESKNIELDVDLEEIQYQGIENLLSHVWTNIIGNAIKFSPLGSTIKITASVKDSNVICTIADEGSGIPEENMRHIFNRFYQCDNSHKQSGNGLGLSLAKKITDIHKGTISAKNLPEKGCVFTVILPI